MSPIVWMVFPDPIAWQKRRKMNIRSFFPAMHGQSYTVLTICQNGSLGRSVGLVKVTTGGDIIRDLPSVFRDLGAIERVGFGVHFVI